MKSLSLEDEARILEYGEANAVLDMVAGAPKSFAESSGLRAGRVGAAPAIVARQMPMILFNRVMCLGIGEPLTRTMVDQAITFLRSEAAPNFAIQLAPVAAVSGADDWLSGHGLKRTNAWARLIRGPAAAQADSTNLTIRPVAPEEAAAFARTFVTAYGVPHELGAWIANLVGRTQWRHFAAWDSAAMAATASLFVQEGVGWLGIAATLPAYRGMGAQNALVARRIREGLDMGCKWFVTETNEDAPGELNQSARNLMRQGFRLAYWRHNFEPG